MAEQIVDAAEALEIRTRMIDIHSVWDLRQERGKQLTIQEDVILPGWPKEEDVVTNEELQLYATKTTDVELWWCRAIARRHKLTVQLADLVWYRKKEKTLNNLLHTE